MAQFEDYVKIEKKDQEEIFRTNEFNKGLYRREENDFGVMAEVQSYQAEYDAKQLEAKFQSRLQDSTYRDRTLYYFQDEGLYAAKARRYWKLSDEESTANKTAEIERYAEDYEHHTAYKRRKAAKAAGNAFGKAALLVQQNHEKEKKAKDDYAIFEMREEVMRLRMEGMEKAAEAKARDARHETYLKARARVSCLMMLQDQLQNLRKNARRFNDRHVLQKFTRKATSLSTELLNAKRKLASVDVSADQAWAEQNNIQQKAEVLYDGPLDVQNDQAPMSSTQAKTLAVLQKIREQNQGNASPRYTLRLDSHGHPLSSLEAQKQEWNGKYNLVMSGNNQDAKNELLLSIAKRVEHYQLPDMNAFQNGSVLEQFYSHGVEYYEMLLKTPDFLNEQMNNEENGVLAQYKIEHPVFAAKLELLSAMGRHLKASMREIGVDHASAERIAIQGLEEADEQNRLQQIRERHDTYLHAVQTQEAAQEAEEPELLSLQTQEEQEEEYAELHRRNPAFTRKMYKVYKELKASRAAVDNPVFQRRFNALKPKYKNLSEISRELGMVLRSVHCDKNGQPISAEDKRKAAQNERFLRAWEEQDQKTIMALIMKEIGNVFDGFDIPEPQNVEKWYKKNMEERTFEFQEMITRALSLCNMEDRFPWVKEYMNTHPAYREKAILLSKLGSMQSVYNKAYYNVQAGSNGGSLEVLAAGSKHAAEENMASHLELFREQIVDQYTPLYNQSQTALTQIEAEKRTMRTTNPDFTDTQYDILKNIQRSYAVYEKHPEYLQQLNTAKKKSKQPREAEFSISRAPGSMLRSILYKSNGEPLTPADQALKEKNDQWMKAWEDGDEKAKEEMALESVPHMYDDFDPPQPKYMRRWVERQLRTNAFRFMEMLRRTTNLSDLQDVLPAVRQFEQENAEFRNKRTLFACMNNYVTAYLSTQNINSAGGTYAVLQKKTFDTRKAYFYTMDVAAETYENQYRQIHGANV